MEPYWSDGGLAIYQGNALDVLRQMPDESVNCCVTSPPYWGLRDYGVAGQLGLERTPDEYIAKVVAIFAEVRRVLRGDGTAWVNMGDCYATGAGKVGECPGGGKRGDDWAGRGTPRRADGLDRERKNYGPMTQPNRLPIEGLKPKDLVGIPWRFAFALRADGWYLRQDIIWAKPNPMPESVRDRCTKAHEYMFMLTKSARYYYDHEAIAEPASMESEARRGRDDLRLKPGWEDAYRGNPPRGLAGNGSGGRKDKQRGHSRRHAGFNDQWDAMKKDEQCSGMRNKRSVWEIATQPFPEAHFATFPEDLIKPCILAGCSPNGIVLDPFAGSGTTLLVAESLNCKGIGIELNPDYIEIAKRRLRQSVFDFSPTECTASA